MHGIMQRANDAHPALKLLTFEFLFSAAPPPSKQSLEAFQSDHMNEYLKAFHRDFAKGFAQERVREAVNEAHRDFLWLDNILSNGGLYLAGSEFSLADIAWMPNFHRFALFQWPFDEYPKLSEWFERVKMRSSYREGLVDWEPAEFVSLVTPRIEARAAAGDGVSAYL
jgi:glutathione S-transferase